MYNTADVTKFYIKYLFGDRKGVSSYVKLVKDTREKGGFLIVKKIIKIYVLKKEIPRKIQTHSLPVSEVTSSKSVARHFCCAVKELA